jgi:hypothetical protein
MLLIAMKRFSVTRWTRGGQRVAQRGVEQRVDQGIQHGNPADFEHPAL